MSDTSPPLYDPEIHTVEDGDPFVRVELWCLCGLAHRQLDPVSAVVPQIASFRRRHDGPGHGPTDPETALAEREARREAGHRALGIQGAYEPRERDTSDLPTEGHDWAADTAGGE
ncbi:hypothetical protein Psed_5803 [Pseudonocardia dioxanivorans CB1190]|uniref:Uncharacterized protein n=1 Tax=Pseudonocardia dioxanivorans (strain ATCC 55486 / DSM 44775 / JCM 13855 / CB1190) TaxID=675635 RepID=F4D1E2_PSEUX|nr:hypothetical protein [Pseudonocardia dioxanivorans]AEA27930.1 hypothetical protein Psed_5803 [Pseudonocardia dioxanivorans CB1190]